MKNLIVGIRARKEVFLSLLLVFLTIFTLVMFLGFVQSTFFYQNISADTIIFYLLSYLPLVLLFICLTLFLLYAASSLESKKNKVLLTVFAVVTLFYLTASFSTPYLSSLTQPSGPQFSDISAEYNTLLKNHTEAEANELLVAWMKKQEDVKDARIADGDGIGNFLYITLQSKFGSTLDSTYPVDSLVGDNAYNSCYNSCPPEGMDNSSNCREICNSSFNK